MNDFTKEELDELRTSRCYHLDDNCPYEDPLFMKLESMIDNYCEHEYVTFLQDQNNESFVEKCTECHALRVCNDN